MARKKLMHKECLYCAHLESIGKRVPAEWEAAWRLQRSQYVKTPSPSPDDRGEPPAPDAAPFESAGEPTSRETSQSVPVEWEEFIPSADPAENRRRLSWLVEPVEALRSVFGPEAGPTDWIRVRRSPASP